MKNLGYAILLVAAIGIGMIGTLAETQLILQRADAQSPPVHTSCPLGSGWNGKECVPMHPGALP